MVMVVRALGPGEERRDLEIVNTAIRGLASRHYPPSAIAGWLEPETDDNVRDLIANADREIRLIAELDGVPSGIGALVVERSELRACYVSPGATRRGCGRLLVVEIERMGADTRTHAPRRGQLAQCRAVLREVRIPGAAQTRHRPW